MTSRVVRGPVRISTGIAVLAMVVAGCGGGGTDNDVKTVADTPSAASPSPSPSVERALALVDDEASADAAKKILVDALANDSLTLEDGTDALLLDTYEPGELTLTIDSPPSHGTATVEGTSLAYTAAGGYGGEDAFTYRLLVKGEAALSGTAVVRITVTESTPTPKPKSKPKPKPKPKPKVSTKPAVYYDNCDAVRAAGADPISEGDPGYAPHLDRDRDGVGCEPWGGSTSGGGSSSGGSSTTGGSGGGGGGGGGDTYYANCTAVRAAGAAPIHSGDPGYGSHLDRDGDGVACE